MENENNTNLEQTVSVIKQPDGYLCIVKGTGREIVESATSLIKSIFRRVLQMTEIKDREKLIVKIWSDLAFDPLHQIIEDDGIDGDDKIVVALAMAEILTILHSSSSKELKDIFDDDEDSDDSRID